MIHTRLRSGLASDSQQRQPSCRCRHAGLNDAPLPGFKPRKDMFVSLYDK
jgi:hypothetical protein